MNINKPLNWKQTKKQSNSNNIDLYQGKNGDILLFEICRFKNDNYIMSINLPGTKVNIINNSDINVLKEKAQKLFYEFILKMLKPDPKGDIYIFLDIDGVVATRRSLELTWLDYMGEKPITGFDDVLKLKNLKFPSTSMSDWPFDVNCISNIHNLQKYFGSLGYVVKYVISSSWRTGRSVKDLKDVFTIKGLHLNKIVGKTKHRKDRKRGLEINDYIKDNNITEAFLVIDDECSYDIEQYVDDKNIINTPFSTGFNYSKLLEAKHKIQWLIDN